MLFNSERGISGCKLELLNKRVFKYSSTVDYNSRLILQMDKQTFFENKSLPRIRVPKVISKGFKDGIFFFEMEYIPGLSPLDFFIFADKNEIDFFLSCLYDYFDHLISNQREISYEYFKITNISKLNTLLKNSCYKTFIDFLIQKVKISDQTKVYKSFCHGDFTGSNMIYMNRNLFLIDFLDSHIDTVLIDFVKLKQDFFYKWSLVNSNIYNRFEKHRIHQVCEYIWRNILEKYKIMIDTFEFKILESLNFLRIEPYLKDENMKLILEQIIKEIPLYEEFNSSNGWKI